MERKTAWLTDIMQEIEDRAREREELLTQAVAWKDEVIHALRQELSTAQTDAEYQRKIYGDLKSQLKDRDAIITELRMERKEHWWLKLPKTLPSQPPKEVEKRRFQQKWIVEYQEYSPSGPWYQFYYNPWVKGTFDSEAEALAAIEKDKFKGCQLLRRARCVMISLGSSCASL